MKRMMNAVLFTLLSLPLTAQEENENVYGLYSWTQEVLMTVCEMNGDAVSGEMPRNSMVGQKFRVLKDQGDTVLIRVLEYTDGEKKHREKSNLDSLQLKGKDSEPKPSLFFKYNVLNPETYDALDQSQKVSGLIDEARILFKVPKSYLKDHARSEEYRRPNIAIGAINFPFKMRFQDGRRDFSGAFNLGVGVGMSLRQKEWKKNDYYVLIGTGITEINLVASEVGRNADLLQDVNGLTALTISMGFMIQREKTQIGLFYGWDHLSAGNHATYDWKQQARPWLSLAIGYAIFSGEGKKANTDSTQ